MPKFSRNQMIILGAAGIVVLFLILVFLGVVPGLRQKSSQKVSAALNFWGVGDGRDAYQNVIDQFQNLHKSVQVKYTRFDPATYESELVNALAAGKGPDIFMINSAWLPKHYDKISPLPKGKLDYATYANQLFPDVVAKDFTSNQTIYAFPLSVDTLVLLYNKDIFNQSGVALTPANWSEFQNDIPKLRILDATGKISRAGAAIGGSDKSVDRAADILALLMLQAGAQMTDPDFTRATFSENLSSGASPGLDSLNFYTHFANPVNFDYTWNDTLPNSLDAFSQGSAAMIFDYASQLAYLKSKNPYLNFGIAATPQANPASPVNYANYWGYAVSNKTSYSDLAWDFILLLTTNQDNALSYLKSTQKPPALRFLIQQYLSDPNLGIFAKQALTAKSWSEIDSDQIETIFSDMIESVITGRQTAKTALTQAEARITQLMKR